MIEKTILDFLQEYMNVPCYLEEPKDPPEEYVILEKTGSSRSETLYDSTFAFQCYAGTLYNAAELTETLISVMDNLDGLNEICRVTLNNSYNYTDTSTKRYRYQTVYDILHY